MTFVVSGTLFAQFPLVMPPQSDSRLSLMGNPAEGYGLTGYRNAALGQPNTGHLVSGVIQNAPNPAVPPEFKLYADYYITGINNSPFTKAVPGIAAARATTEANMPNFTTFVADNGINRADISFHFGQKIPADIQDTWNLGGDVHGVDWTGNMLSPIEQRIYQADGAVAEASLYYLGTKILTFGNSALYEIIDYGPTDGPGDDSIGAYSSPVGASKVIALAGLFSGLADAFLADVSAGGGKVQLYFDTVQPVSYVAVPESFGGTDYIHADYSFSGSIMIVPEPAVAGGAVALMLAGVAVLRRRRRAGN